MQELQELRREMLGFIMRATRGYWVLGGGGEAFRVQGLGSVAFGWIKGDLVSVVREV